MQNYTDMKYLLPILLLLSCEVQEKEYILDKIPEQTVVSGHSTPIRHSAGVTDHMIEPGSYDFFFDLTSECDIDVTVFVGEIVYPIEVRGFEISKFSYTTNSTVPYRIIVNNLEYTACVIKGMLHGQKIE